MGRPRPGACARSSRARGALALCLPLLAACAVAALPTGVRPVAAASAGPSVGPCPLLPADDVWNTDISSLPVDAHSGAWIAASGGSGRLIHPDWGPSGGSVPYGMPWQLVDGSHQKVAVTFQYADESDPGPYPLGPDTPIEGGAGSSGDRHALVVDQSTCTLYETWDTHYSASGSTAGSGAVFKLGSDALRPAGWTSADAAGLPILPGLVRLVEVRSGAIRHAIRFTVSQTDKAYIWPARHQAGSALDAGLPPMGARFRLERSLDISHFSADTRVILTAMQHYGLILADNGSNWYFQGDTDPGWSNETQVLDELKTIPAGDFQAVDESSLMIDPNSGAARQPGAVAAPPPSTPRPTPRPTAAPARAVAAVSPSAAATPAPSATALPPFSPAPTVAPGQVRAPVPGSRAVLATAARGGGPPSAVPAFLAAALVGLALAGCGGTVALLLRRRRRSASSRP